MNYIICSDHKMEKMKHFRDLVIKLLNTERMQGNRKN
jgi:hypothetical protein